MPSSQSWRNLNFETPATYRIRVQGHLSDSWEVNVHGMVITRAFTADKQPMTILVGFIKDQATLAGVLNALDDLYWPILSIEDLDEKNRRRVSSSNRE